MLDRALLWTLAHPIISQTIWMMLLIVPVAYFWGAGYVWLIFGITLLKIAWIMATQEKSGEKREWYRNYRQH